MPPLLFVFIVASLLLRINVDDNDIIVGGIDGVSSTPYIVKTNRCLGSDIAGAVFMFWNLKKKLPVGLDGLEKIKPILLCKLSTKLP